VLTREEGLGPYDPHFSSAVYNYWWPRIGHSHFSITRRCLFFSSASINHGASAPREKFIFIHAHLFALHFFQLDMQLREVSIVALFCELMCTCGGCENKRCLPLFTHTHIYMRIQAQECSWAYSFDLLLRGWCGLALANDPARPFYRVARARILINDSSDMPLCQPWQKIVSYYCPMRASYMRANFGPLFTSHVKILSFCN
jgi:hypothetical protein